MGKIIYSDNTDINGVNYATVGENIREGAKSLTYESVEPMLEENKTKINDALETSALSLKQALISFLSTLYSTTIDVSFGGETVPSFSQQEWIACSIITTNLNINTTDLRTFILRLLSGKKGTWGYYDAQPLTETEKQEIKTFLGIS